MVVDTLASYAYTPAAILLTINFILWRLNLSLAFNGNIFNSLHHLGVEKLCKM